MRTLLQTSSEIAIRYLEEIGNRKVAPSAEAIDGIERFREQLPESPADPEQIIRMLDEIGSPTSVAMAGPRFFGFVIVSEEAHPTLFKSLGMLGLGRNRVSRVPVDGQGRMRTEAIPTINGPTIVCTQAGNINTGAFDPIGDICDAVRSAGAWVHVDGAFGLWAAATQKYSCLTEGICKTEEPKSRSICC